MSFMKPWKQNNSEMKARSQARSCSHPYVTPGVHLANFPILCCLLASVNASNLVIFLAKIIAFQVNFSAKKEATQLEFIKASKSGFYSSLSTFASKLPGFDY